MSVEVKYGMSFEEYQKAPGLSQSAIKRLAESPLTWWTHSPHNPNRPKEEETEFTEFGHAAHTRILEGADVFGQRYCEKLSRADYPDFLASGDELAARCAELGVAKSGTLRERADRIRKADPDALLWIDLEDGHKHRAGNRTELSAKVVSQIEAAAQRIEASEAASKLLTGGAAEVSIFWRDEETGVLLKARLDYYREPDGIVDLKTFNNASSRTLEDATALAVVNHYYGLQAVMYCDAVEALTGVVPRFTFIFLQSGHVPNVVIRHLSKRPGGGQESAFWGRCEREYRHFLRLFAYYHSKFGYEKPWAEPLMVSEFIDEDFPSYAL